MTDPRYRSLLLRVAAGGLLTLVSLGAFAWVRVVARVDCDFNTLPPLPEEGNADVHSLSQYALLLDRLIRQDSTNGVIRKRYATVLARQREYKRALEQLEEALTTANTPDSLFFAADMHDKLGQSDEAIANMEQAVALNPTNPQYNDAYLRLLHQRLERIQRQLQRNNQAPIDDPRFLQARKAFALAGRNWAIRAPLDKNAYLFLGNDYVGPPLFPLQAYRCFLLGLSQAPSMALSRDFMIEPRAVFDTIGQILNGWAKPYKGLSFGQPPAPRRPTATP